jgi:hypothetical protein
LFLAAVFLFAIRLWWKSSWWHVTDGDLSAYYDKDLSSRQESAVRWHLVSCRWCSTRYHQMCAGAELIESSISKATAHIHN